VVWAQFDAPLVGLTSTADVHMRAWHQMLSAYVVAHAAAPACTNACCFTYVDSKLRYDGVRAGAEVVVRDLVELTTP
jgi:hypothetical protein